MIRNFTPVFDSPSRPPPSIKTGGGPSPPLIGLIPPGLDNAAALVARLTGQPADEAAALAAFGCLWLDDRPCLEPGLSLEGRFRFRFNPPAYRPVIFYEADPGRIVYEDDDLLVYNKEAGRPSQGVPYDAHNNVLAAAGRLLAGRGGPGCGGPGRLWLPHRLDADTSGLLALAKNQAAAGVLGRAFQNGLVGKRYLAWGSGVSPENKNFRVQAAIAKEGASYVARPEGPGLAALTEFSVLEERELEPGLSEILFLAEPRTGRTHQIRLHSAWAGWPLRGDRFYGRAELEKRRPAPRLMLAAIGLSLPRPADGRPLDISLV